MPGALPFLKVKKDTPGVLGGLAVIRSDFASRFLPRHVSAEKKIGDGPPFREDHSNIGRGPILWGGHGHGGIDEAKSTCPTPGVTRRPNPCLLRAESMSGLDGNQEVWGGLQPLYLLFFTLGSLWDHFAPGVPHQGNGSHGHFDKSKWDFSWVLASALVLLMLFRRPPFANM